MAKKAKKTSSNAVKKLNKQLDQLLKEKKELDDTAVIKKAEIESIKKKEAKNKNTSKKTSPKKDVKKTQAKKKKTSTPKTTTTKKKEAIVTPERPNKNRDTDTIVFTPKRRTNKKNTVPTTRKEIKKYKTTKAPRKVKGNAPKPKNYTTPKIISTQEVVDNSVPKIIKEIPVEEKTKTKKTAPKTEPKKTKKVESKKEQPEPKKEEKKIGESTAKIMNLEKEMRSLYDKVNDVVDEIDNEEDKNDKPVTIPNIVEKEEQPEKKGIGILNMIMFGLMVIFTILLLIFIAFIIYVCTY